MDINGTLIHDGFAEAFPMLATRLVITADEPRWARIAATSLTGFATSVIACGCEAGIERELSTDETPDGRPGVAVLIFAMSSKDLATQVQRRVGQCVLTAAGSACFAGMADGKKLPLGNALRYFADGFQISKKLPERRVWRLPVMDGEFVCEDTVGTIKGIGGGNFLILATDRSAALAAAEASVEAMRRLANIIMPFPGGMVRSGSKVGSRYKGVIASTNHLYCPTLKGLPESRLGPEVGSVLEIVIDGLSESDIAAATRAGVLAACALGRAQGVLAIDAGNYGGNLGPHHFHLHEILA